MTENTENLETLESLQNKWSLGISHQFCLCTTKSRSIRRKNGNNRIISVCQAQGNRNSEVWGKKEQEIMSSITMSL